MKNLLLFFLTITPILISGQSVMNNVDSLSQQDIITRLKYLSQLNSEIIPGYLQLKDSVREKVKQEDLEPILKILELYQCSLLMVESEFQTTQECEYGNKFVYAKTNTWLALQEFHSLPYSFSLFQINLTNCEDSGMEDLVLALYEKFSEELDKEINLFRGLKHKALKVKQIYEIPPLFQNTSKEELPEDYKYDVIDLLLFSFFCG